MTDISAGTRLAAIEAAGLGYRSLVVRLLEDAACRSLVADVADGRSSASTAAAVFFDAGKSQDTMRALLQLAADEATEPRLAAYVRDGHVGRLRWALVTDALVNLAPATCWVDEPLVPGDARNALQRRAVDAAAHGSTLVCRRGAGRCLRCDAQIVERTRSSYRSPIAARWQRARYCDGCEPDADLVRRSHSDLVRRVMEDTRWALGLGVARKSRRRTRTRLGA